MSYINVRTPYDYSYLCFDTVNDTSPPPFLLPSPLPLSLPPSLLSFFPSSPHPSLLPSIFPSLYLIRSSLRQFIFSLRIHYCSIQANDSLDTIGMPYYKVTNSPCVCLFMCVRVNIHICVCVCVQVYVCVYVSVLGSNCTEASISLSSYKIKKTKLLQVKIVHEEFS